jgi:hypothetical protein
MGNGAIIYTGPTIKTLGLRNRAIFRGELPANLKTLVESNSALAHQFVPLEKYAKQRRQAVPSNVRNPEKVGRKPTPARAPGPPIKRK